MRFGSAVWALAAAVGGVVNESPFKEVDRGSPFQEVAPVLPRVTARQLQSELTRLAEAGDVEGALRARATLRRLRGEALAAGPGVNAVAAAEDVRPDPGVYNPRPEDVGKSFLFRLDDTRPVTASGSTYGTDSYTGGSNLLAAARHSGALARGESAVVRVTVLPGRAAYEATTRNGVTSVAWSRWHVSFKVERLAASAPRPASP